MKVKYRTKKDRIISMYNAYISICIVIISVLISIVAVINRKSMRSGLENLFLVPLVFSFCMSFNIKKNVYLKSGIGLKIFFVIMLIRFNLVPLLISLTNGEYNTLPITMPMISVSSIGYQYSVMIMILEIIVCNFSIYFFRSRVKKIYLENEKNYSNKGISIIGLGALGIFILFLFSRNLPKVFSTFTFFTINEKYQNASVDPFGILAALVIKTFLFLMLTTACYKKYKKSNKLIWVILSIGFGFINMSIFFGYNRSFVLQTAIATIYVLYATFPKQRKIMISILIPICFTIMISMIFIKQFGVSYTEATTNQLTLPELANTIECYVGGPWSLGSGYDAAKSYQHISPTYIFLKDFILNNFISYIPGLEFILGWLPNVVSSPEVHQIYTNSFQMIPLSATCLFYGGTIIGSIIAIIFNVLIIKLLITFDYKSKVSVDISRKYIYTLISILLSFAMCYTWVTLLWSFTKNMLFLTVLILLNEIRISKNSKVTKKAVI